MRSLNKHASQVTNVLPFIGWLLLASVFIFVSFGVKIESKPSRSARNPASEPTVRLVWNH